MRGTCRGERGEGGGRKGQKKEGQENIRQQRGDENRYSFFLSLENSLDISECICLG